MVYIFSVHATVLLVCVISLEMCTRQLHARVKFRVLLIKRFFEAVKLDTRNVADTRAS